MSEIDPKEIRSLIKLLDDPDTEISGHVENKLTGYGASILPYLETEWETSFDAILQQKLENLIGRIQFSDICLQLGEWGKDPDNDLLDGVFLIAKYKYPDLDKQHISNQIDKMKLDVWLELHYSLTSLEKVKIINHVMYNLYGFSGNVTHYNAPQNSYINNVLESRKGNAVSLSVVYQLVAQRLNIPVYGVNLPTHFILAYKDDSGLETISSFHEDIDLENLGKGRILFYINAFNRGTPLTKNHIEDFIKQLNIPPDPSHFIPCTNLDTVKRMLRNLHFSYIQLNDKKREMDVREMLTILGEPEVPLDPGLFPADPEDPDQPDQPDQDDDY